MQRVFIWIESVQMELGLSRFNSCHKVRRHFECHFIRRQLFNDLTEETCIEHDATCSLNLNEFDSAFFNRD